MKRLWRFYCVSIPFYCVLGGCHSAAPSDDKRTTELADKLVSCQNERSSLKDELAQAQAELSRLKSSPAAATAPVGKPGAKIEAGPEGKPGKKDQPARSGRSAPRKLDGAPREIAASRPALHRPTGPSDPAVEAQEARAVVETFRGHASQFSPCYEKGLKRDANLQYTTQIKVHLTVSGDGHARDVHLSPRTPPDMETCVVQLITHWQFPTYRGQPVQLELPVNLKVKGQ